MAQAVPADDWDLLEEFEQIDGAEAKELITQAKSALARGDVAGAKAYLQKAENKGGDKGQIAALTAQIQAASNAAPNQAAATTASTATTGGGASPQCSPQTQIIFNVNNKFEIPVSVSFTYAGSDKYPLINTDNNGYAFLHPSGGKCVGGSYNYSYTASISELLQGKITKTFSGRVTIPDTKGVCNLDIIWYDGTPLLNCY